MNRKLLPVLIFTLLVSLMLQSAVFASQTPIVIRHQPQNSSFPENASATWSVEATGENLTYTWFIVYNGAAYNTKKSFDENHPWLEGVTGDGYGSNESGNLFFINGIGTALNGAQVYCVISDGLYSVTSSSAYITVGTPASPPDTVVPASVTAEKGKKLELSCQATAQNGDSILSYLWYETATGELKDITAIGVREGQPETNPTLVCDTTQTGTRYYLCAVETKKGGFAYSSVISVTVTEAQVTTSSISELPESSGSPESRQPVSEKLSGEAVTTGGNKQTDNQDSSLPMILLISLGGVVIIGGLIAAILIIKRKNPTKNK